MNDHSVLLLELVIRKLTTANEFKNFLAFFLTEPTKEILVGPFSTDWLRLAISGYFKKK